MSLKLLIDSKDHRVLFAEADKDFVDYLFYLFSLPIGAVVKLIGQQNMVGCIGDLYQSITNLSTTYMQPNQSKASVLNPKSLICATGLPLLLSADQASETQKFYSCAYSYSPSYVTDVPDLLCPNCSHKMTRVLSYVSKKTAPNRGEMVEGGFVKGVVTYMVMDNLEVMPMSVISSIALLNKFKVKDFSVLEERVVNLGLNEGLKLLKASLECKTALTSVFLGNAGVRKRRRS